jgi:hypothetical protein
LRYPEVVRLASEEELLQLAAGPDPDSGWVRTMADRVDEDAAVVFDLARLIRNDLVNHAPFYLERKRCFDEAGLDVQQDVQRYVEEEKERSKLSFLLHEELSGWDGQIGELLDAPVFESFDEEDEGCEDAFEPALYGYLVAHNRAFPTVVDRLGTARQQRGRRGRGSGGGSDQGRDDPIEMTSARPLIQAITRKSPSTAA